MQRQLDNEEKRLRLNWKLGKNRVKFKWKERNETEENNNKVNNITITKKQLIECCRNRTKPSKNDEWKRK